MTFNQKGQKGSPGVSAAYYAEGGGGVPVPVAPDDPNFDPGTLLPIAHLNLPAGKFAVTATVEFTNTSDTRAIVGCGFSGINAKVDLAPLAIESDTFVGTYESDVASEVDLYCGSMGGSVVLNHFNSVGTQVDTLTIEN